MVKSVDGETVGQNSIVIKSVEWCIKEWTRWREVVTNVL